MFHMKGVEGVVGVDIWTFLGADTKLREKKRAWVQKNV